MPEALRSLLGFDYGSKKIGVAVGQTLTASASPLLILRNKKQQPDWHSIDRLLQEWQPDALVVGEPLEMQGAATHATAGARKFARQLQSRYGKPVFLADERLTSRAARLDNPHRKTADIDDLAAKLILETWLSEYKNNTN
ncbi:MAG: Holliday junction resolvase RuvX [gamma proteobacterium symbiont of Bathyaustriella thionipta]|nr:Holliday junction resolvase RuvX [gamma proteobacterium symbiont of Bathyaustriella thionipta]